MELSFDTLMSILTKPRRAGKNIRANCPVCGKSEFYVLIEPPHFFQCWRAHNCGIKGNAASLLKLVGRTDLLTVFDNPQEMYSSEVLKIYSFDKKKELVRFKPQVYPLPFGYKRIYHHEYLEGRNFSEYEDYEVGMSKIDPKTRYYYLTFPIRRMDTVVAYLSRCILDQESMKTKDLPRYRNSTNDLSNFLYGEDEIVFGETKTVLLVEGIFDKFNVDRILQLKESNSLKCVSTNGSSVSITQSTALRELGIENVILLHEFDVLEKVKHSSAYLQHMFDTQVGVLLGNDPGDMSEEELFWVLENLKRPDDVIYGFVKKKNLNF